MILLTPAADMARRVAKLSERQLAELRVPRNRPQALGAAMIVTKDLAQCVEISNQLWPGAPDHSGPATPAYWSMAFTSAGSVFLGDWSPESVR